MQMKLPPGSSLLMVRCGLDNLYEIGMMMGCHSGRQVAGPGRILPVPGNNELACFSAQNISLSANQACS